MRRFSRALYPLVAAAALAMPTQAQSVNTLAVSWVVNCADSNAAAAPLLTLPMGTYVVTAEGACSLSFPQSHTVPVTTCVSPVNTLPCVDTGIRVNQVPGATCNVSAGAAFASTCTPVGYVPGPCTVGTIVINESRCLDIGGVAGVIAHGGGSMTARMVDTFYGDNAGAFVVTAVWTPL